MNQEETEASVVGEEKKRKRGRPRLQEKATSEPAKKVKRIDSSNHNGEVSITELRTLALEREQKKLNEAQTKREYLIKELLHLQAGASLLTFDPKSSVAMEAFAQFETPHSALAQGAAAVRLEAEKEPYSPVAGSLGSSFQQAGASSRSGSSTAAGAATTPHVPRRRGRPRSRSTSSESDQSSDDRGSLATTAVLPSSTSPTSLQSLVAGSPPGSLTTLCTESETATKHVAERAAKDAAVLNRVAALQREGFWSAQRLPKPPDPPRRKLHWDHMLEEMAWLAKDFSEERKWKMALARKVSRQVLKYHREAKAKEVLKARKEEQHVRKIASSIARDVLGFWASMEKLVVHKHQSRLDAKKKEALHKHLDFLVDQTQRYSTLLAKDLAEPSSSAMPTNTNGTSMIMEENSVIQPTYTESASETDKEFAIHTEDVDDETTLLQEEDEETKENVNKELAIAKAEQEIAQLRAESEMSLEELLASYRREAGMGENGAEVDDEDEDDEGNDIGERKDEDDKMDIDDEDSDEEDDMMDDQLIPDSKFGTELLLGHDGDEEGDDVRGVNDEAEQKERISAASAAATAAQPTGNTLSTTKVKTRVPFLLKHPIREYQHIGLDWLVTMYEKRLNGILADEMGLGKTIQTIALLAHLACEKKIWGPHLVVVPTSVMLNWDREFRKWCPAFKIMTYYGSPKERRAKRQGWSKPNSFHVCITSYRLVIQDQQAFRRKKWKYLILDEAHHIKNFKSQRWQTLLNFNAKRRLLLTGTPLQNSLMELWSLMHFLMPHLFQSHSQFKKWFDKPVTSIIEGALPGPQSDGLIGRLHAVLRPFLLRRLKRDVEQQLPQKVEHIVPCHLSKRQRLLYEEFMAASSTRDRLASGNFLSIVNVLMQLRKVCNHPDLFEPRPIVSPLDAAGLNCWVPSLAARALDTRCPRFDLVDLSFLNLTRTSAEQIALWQADRTVQLGGSISFLDALGYGSGVSTTEAVFGPQPLAETTSIGAYRGSMTGGLLSGNDGSPRGNSHSAAIVPSPLAMKSVLLQHRVLHLPDDERRKREHAMHQDYINRWRCSQRPFYGYDLCRCVETENPLRLLSSRTEVDSITVAPLLLRSVEEWTEQMAGVVQRFVCVIPTVRARPPAMHCSHPDPSTAVKELQTSYDICHELSPALGILRPAHVRQQIYFPDKRLLQYDCGKLQVLDGLLRRLKAGGHRALIFTQMSRMLDVLEAFLNIHGHIYVRLDGATSIEQRQVLMERFNQDSRIFIFILSTRTGGVGVNLTGADTVIFYDSDWNPAMDQQAQDRCHRIGQTREVHIYRLITKHTVEENILKKANQKRHLHEIVIGEGCFTTEFFKTLTVRDLLEDVVQVPAVPSLPNIPISPQPESTAISQRDWERAVTSAEDETDVAAMDSLRNELAAETEEFEEDLTITQREGGATLASNIQDDEEDDDLEDLLNPIQRYAFRFLEVVNPVVDESELKALHEEVETDQKEWELDVLERIRVEEEDRMEDEDDTLFYEVSGSYESFRSTAIVNLQVYAPPDPTLEELFIPSFDLTEEYPYTLSDLPDLSSTVPSCDEPTPPIAKRKRKNQKKEKDQHPKDHIFVDPSESPSEAIASAPTNRKHNKRKRTLEEKQKKSDKTVTTRKKRKHKDKDKEKEKDKEKDKASRPKADKSKRTKSGKAKETDTKNVARRGNRKVRKINEVALGPPWNETEDQVLLRALRLFGTNWDLISDVLSSAPISSRRRRTRRQCMERWRDVLQPRSLQPSSLSATSVPTSSVASIQSTPSSTNTSVSEPLQSKATKQHSKKNGVFSLLDLLEHRSSQRKKHTQRSSASSTPKVQPKSDVGGTEKTSGATKSTTDPTKPSVPDYSPAHASHVQAALGCGITPDKTARTPTEVFVKAHRARPESAIVTPKLHQKFDTKLGSHLRGTAIMRGKEISHADNAHGHLQSQVPHHPGQHPHMLHGVHMHTQQPPPQGPTGHHPSHNGSHAHALQPIPGQGSNTTPSHAGVLTHPSLNASPRAIKPFTSNGGITASGNSIILNSGSTTQPGHPKFAQINQMMTQNMQLLAALAKPPPTGLQPKAPPKKGRQPAHAAPQAPAGRGRPGSALQASSTNGGSAGIMPAAPPSTPSPSTTGATTAIPSPSSAGTSSAVASSTTGMLMPPMGMPMSMGMLGIGANPAPGGGASMSIPLPLAPLGAVSMPMGIGVPLPTNQPPGSGQAGATPMSTLLALYSITQLPTSTAQIHDIIRRNDTPESTKVEMLRRVIQEHTPPQQGKTNLVPSVTAPAAVATPTSTPISTNTTSATSAAGAQTTPTQTTTTSAASTAGGKQTSSSANASKGQ